MLVMLPLFPVLRSADVPPGNEAVLWTCALPDWSRAGFLVRSVPTAPEVALKLGGGVSRKGLVRDMNCKFSDEDLRTMSSVKLQKALETGNAVHAAEFYAMMNVSS